MTILAARLNDLLSRAARSDEMLDLARRVQADFLGYQERARRDKEEAARYRAEALAKDLIPALDALQGGLSAAGLEGVVEGMRMVESELLKALARHGIVEIDALGKPFDPRLHQAVEVAPAVEGGPASTVLAVLKRGYRLHDRILRPAMVRVSGPG